MTTEPRDPRVRKVVMELLRAAPAPPPLPDVAHLTDEPSPARGNAWRLRAIAATVAVLIVAATVAVVAIAHRPSPRRAPITTPSTTVPPLGKAAPDVAYIDRRGLVVRTRGSSREIVVATGAVTTPLWSPDGEWLAFAKDNALWVVRSDGSHRQRLSGGGGLNYELHLYAWSPTVDALAGVDNAGVRVWWFSGASVHSVSIVPPVVGVDTGTQGLAWSRGGSSIGISIETRPHPGPSLGEESLWLAVGVCQPIAPLTCGPPRQLQRLAGYRPGPDDFPVFAAGVSFDNNYLLVWPDAGGSGSVIQDGLPLEAASLNGGPTVTIATTLVRSSWVQSSPNGSQLLVVRSNGRMVTDSREVDVCATPAHCTAVAPGTNVQTLDPAWSPDGKRIAFVREPAASSIPPFFDGDPGWSTKYRTRQLWVANADGSQAVEITAAGGGIADPQFAPDGGSIVFVRDARLWQIDLTTKRVTPLSGSMRVAGSCTVADNCLPDVNVYETTSLWSDHEAVVFPATSSASTPVTAPAG